MPLRAILAPYDKTGLVDLARGMAALGIELFATGNTHRVLTEAGVNVKQVSDLTGFPEILDGRVKTLHPAVHGGILARRDKPEHLAELAKHGLGAIDIVVGNLYPFQQTVAKDGVALEDALENIDIGGPTMLRAAAKNFQYVLPVIDPADYGDLLDALRHDNATPAWRRKLAVKTFQHVALYDTAIASYLRGPLLPLPPQTGVAESREEPSTEPPLSTPMERGPGGEAVGEAVLPLSTPMERGPGGEAFPEELTLAYTKLDDLRYGENPHQRSALYAQVDPNIRAPQGVVAATQLHGKALSYVNVLDADAAYVCACDFDEPTAVIVKHMTPCGIASRDDLAEAFALAFAADPISAFGGIIAFNRPVDESLAKAVREAKHPTSGQRLFVEIVVAPDFSERAIALLTKSKDLRILRAPAVDMRAPAVEYHGIAGGMLAQEFDRMAGDPPELRVLSKRQPADDEMRDLRYAWRCVKHVKSNAVVVVKDRALVGMGAGQPNRVTSARLAVASAGDQARGAVSASDALIPFPDTVELCAAAGITAIIQTGGSIRDDESIAVCDANNMAMVATGIRHFRH